MENRRFQQARHTGIQLAIAGQLYQRGLINQNEYRELKQMLTNNRLEISSTQDAVSSSNPKKHRRRIKKGGQEKSNP